MYSLYANKQNIKIISIAFLCKAIAHKVQYFVNCASMEKALSTTIFLSNFMYILFPKYCKNSNNKYNANGEANLQSCAYGYNRWSMSAMRKYLNSVEAKDAWWSPSDNADRPPQQLAALDGFMAGFDADFLKALPGDFRQDTV